MVRTGDLVDGGAVPPVVGARSHLVEATAVEGFVGAKVPSASTTIRCPPSRVKAHWPRSPVTDSPCSPNALGEPSAPTHSMAWAKSTRGTSSEPSVPAQQPSVNTRVPLASSQCHTPRNPSGSWIWNHSQRGQRPWLRMPHEWSRWPHQSSTRLVTPPTVYVP